MKRTSIKVRLGATIVLGIGTTLACIVVAARLGAPMRLGAAIAVVAALLAVQLVARGMTRPLREMADAADAMRRGDHGVRVDAPERAGSDEVARLARAFNAMAAELERTDRLRRDLVADVAHELRTPLTALQASLENLVDGVGTADPAAMHGQVVRLGRLVEQLLDLSRLEAGSVPLEPRTVPVAEVVDGVRREATAAFDVRIDPPDLTCRADPERLHQVVANLVENGRRHARSHVGVRAVALDGGGVEIAVADDGPGIPPADRERVFERFARGDAARDAAGGGAGLGLAIARGVVELHGGTLAVADGPGCTMVVRLPA